MHSPRPVFTCRKVPPPLPPYPVLVIFNFNYFYYEVDSVLWLVQPSIDLLEFTTFCATKVCLFSTHHSLIIPFSSPYFNPIRGPWLLVLPRIMGSFCGFFVLFYVENFRNSGNIFSHFGRDQLTLFLNLPGEHPLIRVLGKYGKANYLLVTSSSTWQTEDYYLNRKFYLKTLNPKKTRWRRFLYNSNSFFNGKSS